jgi:hypothetical protein
MRIRWIVAGVMIAAGLVWMAQGTGLLRGSSFMTDDIRWAVAGLALVIGGAIVAAFEVRRRRA